MFEMKFKDAVKGAKLATKLVTAVTIFGLATGCVSEQVKNDDPTQDLPALVLNDESADSSGSVSASPEESSDSSDLALDESSATMGTADGSLVADSSAPSTSSELSYTPPAELPPLAPSPSISDSSSSTKKVAKKASKKVASKKKKKSSKVAKHSKKKAKKVVAKKQKKEEAPAAAASIAMDVPPAPPADGITLDGASDSMSGSTSGSTSAAMDNSAGMNLPADPSAITSQETTSIEPPLVLSQSPDIAANSEGSFLWICFAAGMVVLAGLVFIKMKRRREVSRY